jgi:hypothetical protein
VGNDADSHELFTVVATVHHEGVGETLNDRALGLSKALDGISASRVRDVDWCADLDVIAVGKISVQNSVNPSNGLLLESVHHQERNRTSKIYP